MLALSRSISAVGSVLTLALFVCMSPLVSATESISIRADAWFPMNGDPDAERPGYMIELAEAIFEPRGYEIDYAVMPWARSLLNVSQGIDDCVVGAYIEDAPDFIFPSTHWGEDQTLFWKRHDSDWTYEDLSSLEDITVGLIHGYAYERAFDNHMEAAPDGAEFISANNALEQNIHKLRLGRIDVTVESRLVMEAKLQELGLEGEIVPAGRLGDPDPMYMACSPKNPDSERYARWIDSGTRKLRESGELQAILERYGIEDWHQSQP